MTAFALSRIGLSTKLPFILSGFAGIAIGVTVATATSRRRPKRKRPRLSDPAFKTDRSERDELQGTRTFDEMRGEFLN